MNIHFWGVRGSVPTPISPQQVQSKIMAAIQRAKPEDLQNAETRAKFVSSLPSWRAIILEKSANGRAGIYSLIKLTWGIIASVTNHQPGPPVLLPPVVHP